MLGTLGNALERCSPKVANSLSLPARTWGVKACTGASITATSPLINANIDGVPPLNGTCSNLTPVSCENNSAARWVMLPKPNEPYGTWPRWVLASVTSSFTDRTGNDGLTIKPKVLTDSWTTGAKSRNVSYGRFL